MSIVDVHAHWTPQRYRDAIAERGEWYGLDGTPGELHNSGFTMTLEERIADMDALGVDMQLISPAPGFYQYANEVETTTAIARECNDEVAEIVTAHPERFAGLGTLPMQDVAAASAELERAVTALSLKGAIISDHVLGRTYDEPEFLAFWETAERLGAVIFFHQGFDQRYKIDRYFLNNSVSNLVERTLNFGVLAAGGVLDRFPRLKLLLAHAGGYVACAAARMDKAAGAFAGDLGAYGSYRPPYKALPNYRAPAASPPSAYLRNFYYDCCTFSAPYLRFMIDTLGIDRIVFGTDAPAPMVLTDGVRWLESLDCISEEERRAILIENPATLLEL